MLGRDQQALAKNVTFGQFEILKGEAVLGRHQMVDFFFDMWRTKGGYSHAISRSDIRPQEMKQYLEHVVIMDVERADAGWSLIVRLIGGHVVYAYGEITGKDIREMENTQAVERIYYTSNIVIEEKQPVLTITPGYSQDKLFMEATAFYMPLFDETGDVAKILVCVDVSTQGIG